MASPPLREFSTVSPSPRPSSQNRTTVALDQRPAVSFRVGLPDPGRHVDDLGVGLLARQVSQARRRPRDRVGGRVDGTVVAAGVAVSRTEVTVGLCGEGREISEMDGRFLG